MDILEIENYLINNRDSVPALPKVKEEQHWTYFIFSGEKKIYREATEGERMEAYFESEEFKSVSSPTWEICTKLWKKPESFRDYGECFNDVNIFRDTDTLVLFSYTFKTTTSIKSNTTRRLTITDHLTPSCFNKEEKRLIGEAILAWKINSSINLVNKKKELKKKIERDLLKEKYCD